MRRTRCEDAVVRRFQAILDEHIDTMTLAMCSAMAEDLTGVVLVEFTRGIPQCVRTVKGSDE